jgi:hypothetical protein
MTPTKMLSEMHKLLQDLEEKKGNESPQKTLETISRWLKGLTPASNAFARRMAVASASPMAPEGMKQVAKVLKEMVSLVSQLDTATKKALSGK